MQKWIIWFLILWHYDLKFYVYCIRTHLNINFLFFIHWLPPSFENLNVYINLLEEFWVSDSEPDRL